MSFLAGLGSFAGGVAKGFEEGEDLSAKQLQIQQQKLQSQAQDALGRAFMQPDQGGQANPMGTGVSGLGQMGQQPPQSGQAPSPSPGQGSQPMQPANQNAPQPGAGMPQPVQSAPLPPAQGPQATPQMMNATAGQESGGNYKALGPQTGTGDRAYGKYQVMGANIPQWTQEVLGRPMQPQEFLNNPQAQDAVYRTKFGQLAQKYGPEGAAKAWFAGEKGMNNPNAKDVNGMTVQNYGQKFADSMGPGGQPAPQGGQGQSQASPQGQSQIMQLAQKIKQANPGIKPGVLWQAMAQAAPMMNQEAQQAFKEQTLQLRSQLQDQREQTSLLINSMNNVVKERGQDTAAANTDKRTATTERGQDMTAASRKESLDIQRQRVQMLSDNARDAKSDKDRKYWLDKWKAEQGNYLAAQRALTGAENVLTGADPGQVKDLQGAVSKAKPGDAPDTGPRNEDAPPRDATPANASSQPVQVKSADDYAKVPPGAQYMDPNGNIRTKPAAAGPPA